MPIENLIGKHPAFLEGPKITAESDGLWAEFQACMKLAIDPDVMFAKDKYMRMLIVGGVIADNAINAMRSYDIHKENERKAEAKSKKGKRK